MVFKYRLDFGAGILIGKETDVAVGKRLIPTEKHTEFLDNGNHTFRKQAWSNKTGGHGVPTVIGNHTEIQRRDIMFLDIIKEFGEMGKENA